ncbi:MAG: helix-turn-helix domain-containing protein [Actinomycetota bacterium]
MATQSPEEQPDIAPVTAGVGQTLREARIRMGKELPECAEQLRIRQVFLQALEDGRNRDLPGGAYAVGFLRSYAEFLGLDGEEMVRRFRAEGVGDFATRTELVFPSPVTEGRIPGGAVIFLGLILAGVAYGAWYWMSSRDAKVAENVPSLPDRLASVLQRPATLTGDAAKPEAKIPEDAKAKEEVVPPSEGEDDKTPHPTVAAPEAPKPAEPVAAPEAPKLPDPASVDPAKAEPPKMEPPKPAEAVKAPEPAKPEPTKPEPAKAEPPKAPEPAKPEPAKAPEPPKAEPVKAEPAKAPEPPKPVEAVKAPEPAPEPPAPAAEAKVYGQEHADARVVLKAVGDDCWVLVREMDGQQLLSRLLRKGDSYRVPNRSGLTLMVGNAGALEVTVDGRKAPALGATGQVKRDIRLDPDKLLSGG